MSKPASLRQQGGATRGIAALVWAVILLGGTGFLPGMHLPVGAGPFGSTAASSARAPSHPPAEGGAPLARIASSECGFYGAAYGPAGAVFDSGTGQVFVADSETNDVYVISTSTNQVVTTISLGPVCFNPFGLTYDPNLGEVFVAETGNAAVAAISDVSDTVVATYPVTGQPWNIAYDTARDALFVTDTPEGNISVVSLDPGVPTQTISVGRLEQPLGITYDPAKGELFVADSAGNFSDTLSVLSDTTDSVIASVPMACAGVPGTFGEIPFGVEYDPSNGFVYASCEAADGLAIISPMNNTQVGIVPTEASGSALAFDAETGDIWAAAPFASEVLIVSTQTNSVVFQGPTGGFSLEGIAIDTGTGNVYVSNWKSSNVTVFSPSAVPIASINLSQSVEPAGDTNLSTLTWVPLVVGVGGGAALTVAVFFRIRQTESAPGPRREVTGTGPRPGQ